MIPKCFKIYSNLLKAIHNLEGLHQTNHLKIEIHTAGYDERKLVADNVWIRKSKNSIGHLENIQQFWISLLLRCSDKAFTSTMLNLITYEF